MLYASTQRGQGLGVGATWAASIALNSAPAHVHCHHSTCCNHSAVTIWPAHIRADLEWSGGAARAPPCTVGYLAGGPPLETARCEAAQTHSQQLTEDLQEAAVQLPACSAAAEKKENRGAAGSSSAACQSILVCLLEIFFYCPGTAFP